MANVVSSQSLAVSALSTLADLASLVPAMDLSKKFDHYRTRFVEAFKARDYTNEGFGARIDAHPVTVSKLRNGTIKLDDEWRARVARGLAIDEGLLFGEEPLPTPAAHEKYVSPKKALKAKGKPQRPPASNDNLPLFGLAAGSLQGATAITTDPIEQIPCPPALRDVWGAYALRTHGDSMVPRYFPRDVLYVNPNQRVQPGDHVVIQTERYDGSGTETWVKRLDALTESEVRVSQYNPDSQITFTRKYVRHIHRVLPVNELFGLV